MSTLLSGILQSASNGRCRTLWVVGHNYYSATARRQSFYGLFDYVSGVARAFEELINSNTKSSGQGRIRVLWNWGSESLQCSLHPQSVPEVYNRFTLRFNSGSLGRRAHDE